MIEVHEVSKRYGDLVALDRVSLRAATGECLAIIGKNGSGKSTLLRLLVGLEVPDNGWVRYGGGAKLRQGLPLELKQQLGAFLGDELLMQDLSAREYLRFVADLYSIHDFDHRIAKFRALFEFTDERFTTVPIRDYSMGMRRKVAIMSVLMHEPRYLILDEIFSALDYNMVDALIRQLKQRLPRTTLILTSHILPYLYRLMDKVVVLEEGRVRYSGAPSGLTDDVLPPANAQAQLP